MKKKGDLCTPDALIKNKDNDSWEGGTGSADSSVWVTFEPGADPIQCRRSRLKCKGAFACERVDPRLLERQTRRDEGSTRERRATQFLQMVSLFCAIKIRFRCHRSSHNGLEATSLSS
ncbi:hypothetical protein MSAN_02269100 [Mycena sanguinolenta]|uniref:Uncharacterized protein n=1 Tax=Mycena sanguinolenta TaxID=230812 RepID=A0A8H6XBC1_9AGAR|nr:hypothetical protein MSAN_02269100 [Mycena sanguinolenta]